MAGTECHLRRWYDREPERAAASDDAPQAIPDTGHEVRRRAGDFAAVTSSSTMFARARSFGTMEMPESKHEAAYAMNRFLASAIGTMNALIAIVLLATTVLLFVLSINEGSGASTVILIGGVLGTVMLCGFIAILVDIRVTLHDIRDIANPRFHRDAP